MYQTRITNGLVYRNGSFEKTNIYITNGIIKRISKRYYKAKKTVNAKGYQVLPGIIDPHTHFDLDLGTISSQDDFSSGTRAAIYGGVTTIIDFLEPVDNADALSRAFQHRKKQALASRIDYKFHACVKNPVGQVEAIIDRMKQHGLNTVKLFTTYSDSNRRTYDREIREFLRHSKKQNFTVLAHIENDDMIIHDQEASYQDLPDLRPTESETSEALKLASFSKELKGNLYMVHLSSGITLQTLLKHYPKALHKHMMIESCPHYFYLNRHALEQTDGQLYTMAPPLRSEEERQLLTTYIDHIDTIGTDHCTFTKEQKNKKLLQNIPLGIGGVEDSFRLLYTMFGEKIIDKMTKNVAKIHYLYPQKGVLEVGSDADLFLYELTPTTIGKGHSKTRYSLYQNTPVNGHIIATMSRGKFVLKDGRLNQNKGRCLHQEVTEDEGH